MTNVYLPRLHKGGQRLVADSDARFKILACGRRWGKTRLGSVLVVMTALAGKRAWWIAPSYKMAAVGWRGIRQLAQQVPGAEIRRVDRMATMPSGGWAQVRSADDPQSLRGEGLDLVVIDECAFVREAAWNEALRPSLSDRKGGALFISTPKGRNWFWRAYQRGLNGGGEWASWTFPTSANPYIDGAEVEAARESLPDRIFRQEYLAEFIPDAGGVFRRVMEAATADELAEAERGHAYVFGVDWGKYADFTVIAIVDATVKRLVAMDRFNQIDYALQVGRLKALYELFRPVVIVAERNAMGEPLVEQLQRDGLPVAPFTTTNATKAAVVEALVLAFERLEIGIFPDPVLIGELQGYEISRTPSGMVRYSAPEGMHDDTVIALALAWAGATYEPEQTQVIYAPARIGVDW